MKTFLLFLGVWFSSFGLVGAGEGTPLSGTVVEVNGEAIVVRIDGTVMPRHGDRCELAFLLPDKTPMVVGTWRVTGNRKGLIEATFVEGSGSAGVGYQVVCISSLSASQKRPGTHEAAPSQTVRGAGIIVPQGLEIRDSAWLLGELTVVVVGADAADEPGIEIEDHAIVDADVLVFSFVDSDSAVEIDSGAQVLSSVRRFEARALVPVLPETRTVPGRPEDCNFDSKQRITLTDDRYCKDFTLEDKVVVLVSGNIVIVVEDEFEVEDEARLVLSPGSTLKLITRGKVKISNDETGGGVNPDGRSADFILLHQSNEEIVIGGRSRVQGRIFAQRARLTLKNRARFQGAFSGRRLVLEGKSGFEVSDAIAEVQGSDIGAPLPFR